MKPALTIDHLIAKAKVFCQTKSSYPELFGVTDGKAIGTIIEHNFKQFLAESFIFEPGNAAFGIDLPGEKIETDIKVTSIKQPQSSCPFKDAKQKIYGLGYNLLLFVYEKEDDPVSKTARINFVACTFVKKERTADYTTTFRLREMVQDGANAEDIFGYLSDRNIPSDDVSLMALAEQILVSPPGLGYLTISNALQWRLQYKRVIALDQPVEGITQITEQQL